MNSFIAQLAQFNSFPPHLVDLASMQGFVENRTRYARRIGRSVCVVQNDKLLLLNWALEMAGDSCRSVQCSSSYGFRFQNADDVGVGAVVGQCNRLLPDQGQERSRWSDMRSVRWWPRKASLWGELFLLQIFNSIRSLLAAITQYSMNWI